MPLGEIVRKVANRFSANRLLEIIGNPKCESEALVETLARRSYRLPAVDVERKVATTFRSPFILRPLVNRFEFKVFFYNITVPPFRYRDPEIWVLRGNSAGRIRCDPFRDPSVVSEQPVAKNGRFSV